MLLLLLGKNSVTIYLECYLDHSYISVVITEEKKKNISSG